MLTNYFAVSFPLNQHPDKNIYTMASTDSASIATDKITINGKQVWHLLIRSMIFCFLYWKPVLILSLLFAFITAAASTIDFNSIGFFAPRLIELFQSLEPRDNENILGLVRFAAVTFIIWLIFSCFIITLVGIAWYRFILSSGDENILRSVFRWGNKHTRFFLWQLVVQFIMILAFTSLFIVFAGAIVACILLLSNSPDIAIAIMLVILLFFMLFLFFSGVFLRACLIFPCLIISSDISIKQIFNKTTSNFNTFYLLIPLQLILVILGTYILMLLLALLTIVLLDIILNEIYSQYSYVSVFMTEFSIKIPVAFSTFWLATFVMLIASHFFPAQFKSLSSK